MGPWPSIIGAIVVMVMVATPQGYHDDGHAADHYGDHDDENATDDDDDEGDSCQ